MDTPQLCADYLVVGAGIAGLGFVDVLLREDQKCTVVIADLFDGPGGKYNQWPKSCAAEVQCDNWGVESKKFEGCTVDDVLQYCQEVLRSFIESGRVRFFPRHKANEAGTRLAHVLDADHGYDVCVTRKVVDATCTMPRTQLGPAHNIEVDCSAQLVSPCSMPNITSTHSQYVVIGSGYIGSSTVVWLLSVGVSPDKILWVVPRSRRFSRKEVFKADVAGEALGMLTACLCTCPSLLGIGMMLEEAGLACGPDAGQEVPELYNYRCFVSEDSISMLRKVTNVIRMGHVQKISAGHMLLDGGRCETAKDAMYIDCTGSRMRCYGKPEPVWQSSRIKLQLLQQSPFGDISLSVGTIGMVEARFPTAESDVLNNSLFTPLPYTESLADFMLSCTPQIDVEAWKRKDLQRLALDRMSMRVNPMAKSPGQLKYQRQWSDMEVIKKVTNNVLRVVTREDPGALQKWTWFIRPHTTEPLTVGSALKKLAKGAEAAQIGAVEVSAEKSTDPSAARTRQASPHLVSSNTDCFFDFDVLDQLDIV